MAEVKTTQVSFSVPFDEDNLNGLIEADNAQEAIEEAWLERPLWTSLDCGEFENRLTLQALNSSVQTLSNSVATPSVVTIDSIVTEVSQSNKITVNGSNEIVFDVEGLFTVSFNVGIDNMNGSRSSAETRLQVDTGSGFSNVPGAITYTYHRNNAQGIETGSASVLVDISQGDKLRIVSARFSGGGSLDTVAQACNITIQSYQDRTQQSGFHFDCGSIDDLVTGIINTGDL